MKACDSLLRAFVLPSSVDLSPICLGWSIYFVFVVLLGWSGRVQQW